MTDPKWLSGYLATLPKRVRTLEDGSVQGDEAALPKAAAISSANMTEAQKKIVATITGDNINAFDAFVADMEKSEGRQTARARTKHRGD